LTEIKSSSYTFFKNLYEVIFFHYLKAIAADSLHKSIAKVL